MPLTWIKAWAPAIYCRHEKDEHIWSIDGCGNIMRSIVLTGAAILCAAPISLHQSQDNGLSISLSGADARVGRPATPWSIAGVHRRAVRRCARGVTCY